MRFSQAIRLGAMIRPQGFGDLEKREVVWRSGGPLGLTIEERRTCANGAAYEALGISTRQETMEVGEQAVSRDGVTRTCTEVESITKIGVDERLYNFLTRRAVCPVCEAANAQSVQSMPVYVVNSHLNDVHRWTRERIADWVATQEEVATGGAPGVMHVSEIGEWPISEWPNE